MMAIVIVIVVSFLYGQTFLLVGKIIVELVVTFWWNMWVCVVWLSLWVKSLAMNDSVECFPESKVAVY